jgi:hypothetical protein
MENFKQIKEEILRRAKSASACVVGYKRALESQSLEELAQVIKDNFKWCVYNRVLDTKIISEYREEFASVGIYANESRNDGYVVIDSEVENLSGNAIAILYNNATVNKVCGNATVNKVCGNATVNRVWGNATVNEVRGNATVNEVRGNATVNRVWGNATVNKVWGNATVNEVCGNATVNRVWDNATVNRVWDNATVNEVCGNAYISVYSYIECKINNNAIMRVRSENKIYTNTEVERPNNN